MHVFIFFFFFGNYFFTIIFHVSHLWQKFHNSPRKFSLIAISLYETEKHTEISFASLCSRLDYTIIRMISIIIFFIFIIVVRSEGGQHLLNR